MRAELEGLKTLILEPNANSRSRLVQVLKSIIYRLGLDYAKDRKDALELLVNDNKFDCIFLSSDLSTEKLQDFISRARATAGGKDALYIVSLGNDEKESSNVASLFLRGIDGFVCQPFSADEIQELLIQAKAAKIKEGSGVGDDARLVATLDFLLVDAVAQIDNVASRFAQGLDGGFPIKSLKSTGTAIKFIANKIDKRILEKLLIKRFENCEIPKNYVGKRRKNAKGQRVFHPGRVISEIIRSRKLTPEFIAGRMASEGEHFLSMLREETPLDDSIAQELARVLGETARHWRLLQSNYDKYISGQK